MSEDATVTTTEETTATTTTEAAEDQRIPYERFEKVNKQAKEAKDRAAKLEKELGEIRSQLEERESAGLPELEQTKKRLEAAEKRAMDAERLAEEKDRLVAVSRAERFVIAAAKDFVDADDAVRNVDLGEIESAEDAERAVKRVAKAKPHLLKGEEKPLPGRVLEGGQLTKSKDPGKAQLESEAAGLAAELGKHIKR